MSAIRHMVTVLLLGAVLAGCQQEGSDEAEAEDVLSDVPDILAPQRAACERSGGQWGNVPNRDTFVCYRITRDANRGCSSKRDCEGLCLARSRSCAPQVPLFGCHEVLNAGGLRQTLCIE